MTDRLRIAHLRIAPQWAILRWAILTFTDQNDEETLPGQEKTNN